MQQKSFQNDKATLFLIATPIGNMDDITYRAVEILKNVEVIFSEDTRVTQQLLNHFDIHKKLISSHQYNEKNNQEKLLSYLEQGKNVGLVTDRGTPIISDPGNTLATFAIKNGYNVVAIPGATAFVCALITSGIDPQPFTFYGFLNSKQSKRRKELEELKYLKTTLIFYEAPHRLQETLFDILEILGNRACTISREITKKYEEIIRGNVEDIIKQTEDIKGEIVIVVAGNKEVTQYEHLSIVEHVNLYIKEGKDVKEAIKIVSKERNIPKNTVYMTYHGKDE